MTPDQIVAEMHELGAQFTVTDGKRWTWQPRPEIMRNAIRRFLNSVERRPSGEEMVAAIRRLSGGASC